MGGSSTQSHGYKPDRRQWYDYLVPLWPYELGYMTMLTNIVVAIGFATISFGDMMIANRKKKQEWYTEQEAAYERALAQARVAEANGTLTSNLSLFLNHDRATQQAEAEKRNKLSLWQRSKNLLSSGLGMKGESLVEGADRRTPEQDPSEALHKRGREQARMVGAQDSVSLSEASPVPKPSTAEDSRIVESRAGPAGGPLDRLGDQTSSSVSHTAGSLLGRFRGN